MSARVLIVSDDALDLMTLEARLTADYLDVLTAPSGVDALAACARGECDIVVLGLHSPGMDGMDVCRRLKRDPQTCHIPVVMVIALGRATERLRALEAGADEVAFAPLDEGLLIGGGGGVAGHMGGLDAGRGRGPDSARYGIADPIIAPTRDAAGAARILLIEDRASAASAMKGVLEAQAAVDLESDPQEVLFKVAEGDYHLLVVSLGLQGHDGLRLCSQLRSLERTRRIPMLAVGEPDDRLRILRGLELGIDDYVFRPVEGGELAARARTQLRRKRYADRLRADVQATIEMAVVDTLTGLSNRRVFDSNFTGLVERAARSGRPLSLMILDIDHFKKVNDTYGHDAGDQILKAFAARVRHVVRSSDLFCRLGGEEFAIIMPDTDIEIAARVAERVRDVVERTPFVHTAEQPAIRVTSSIGLAERASYANAEALLRGADLALYESKGAGRNRVTARAA